MVPIENLDKAVRKMEEIDAEKLLYQKAYNFATNYSYIFYVVLGFFVAITRWYYENGNDKLAIFKLNIENIIAIIMLTMLMIIAKVSRLSADNQDYMDDFEDKYKPKIKFHSTGVRGVGDFLSYSLLTSITSYFIILAFNKSFSLKLLLYYCLGLMFLVYYVLANGNFIKSFFICKKQDKNRRRNKEKVLKRLNVYVVWQLIAYFLMFILIGSLFGVKI
jgi:hypothetical protein